MFSHRNEYLFSDDLLPVQKHQAYDEILQFEKEFAAVIYAQRYHDKFPMVHHYGKQKE